MTKISWKFTYLNISLNSLTSSRDQWVKLWYHIKDKRHTGKKSPDRSDDRNEMCILAKGRNYLTCIKVFTINSSDNDRRCVIAVSEIQWEIESKASITNMNNAILMILQIKFPKLPITIFFLSNFSSAENAIHQENWDNIWIPILLLSTGHRQPQLWLYNIQVHVIFPQ